MQGQEYPFMADTGATYSTLERTGSKLPLSNLSVETIGFPGKTQIAPVTQQVPVRVIGLTITASLLYLVDTRIN